MLAAGWPESVTGTTIDRQCGSSQQAVHFAAAGLVAGQYDVVVAGGVESMSRVPMGSSVSDGSTGRPLGPAYLGRYDGVVPNQGVGAEMIAERWGLSRTQLDEFALRLPREGRRGAAPTARFDEQIAPVHAARRHRGRPPTRASAGRHAGEAGRAEDGRSRPTA